MVQNTESYLVHIYKLTHWFASNTCMNYQLTSTDLAKYTSRSCYVAGSNWSTSTVGVATLYVDVRGWSTSKMGRGSQW